jgi:hypothetical protein
MRYYTFTFFCLIFFSGFSRNSNFDIKYSAIETELIEWDAIRGKWLSAYLKSMFNEEIIPVRNFPEDFSPHEMMALVPAIKLSRIHEIAKEHAVNNTDLLEGDHSKMFK